MLRSKFRGVNYRIRIGRMKGHTVGCATDPKKPKPTLCFDPAMFRRKKFTKDLLEVLIHEALHACLWDIDEEAIHETGVDIFNFLKKVGVTCDATVARQKISKK